MSDTESDIDESGLPDRETCDKLCDEFAKITKTDTACAQFFLQDRQWDLQRSVNAYFETKSSQDRDESELIVEIGNVTSSAAATAFQEQPSTLKLISWNIDGLDEKNIKRRTKFVCKIIENEFADVVFLQEVVPSTLSIIEKHLNNYKIFRGNEDGYFTAILTRRNTIECSNYDVIPFPTTAMDRNLLVVKATIGKAPLLLITSHLESTKEHSSERMKQLRIAFKYALDNKDEKTTVLLGGDFNLRDQELDKVGGTPAGLEDMWICCGSRPECRYTWDMTRNDNLMFSGRFKPRCRFDRIYIGQSNPSLIIPQHFGLIGLERLKTCRSFPSDHWGLVSRLSLQPESLK